MMDRASSLQKSPHRPGGFLLLATWALVGLVAIIFAVGWLRDRGVPGFLLAPEIILALVGSSLLAAVALGMFRNLAGALRVSLAPVLAFAAFSGWIVAGSWLAS